MPLYLLPDTHFFHVVCSSLAQTEADDEKRLRMLELERTLAARQKDLDRLKAQYNTLTEEHTALKELSPTTVNEELQREVKQLRDQLTSSNKCM